MSGCVAMMGWLSVVLLADASGGPLNAGDEGQAWTAAYTSLPAAEYPHVAAVRRHVHTMTGSAFETALDLLLEAVAARAVGERA